MLLTDAAESLRHGGVEESIILRTLQQDTETFKGQTVVFNVASASDPHKKFIRKGSFTFENLHLSEQIQVRSYSTLNIYKSFKHLQLPIQAFNRVQPTLLIGSSYPHLLYPVEYVILGRGSGPAAVHMHLGWALQGPTLFPEEQAKSSSAQNQAEVQVLFVGKSSNEVQLRQDVQRLWQIDSLAY